ncbi:hypothetical protein ACJRO7_007705 [Eucalyptus globulus]|uniref:Uncharacterized protein n=1 Tax=Eucalyptus globulus TaxID=34317 RepID=A0ABD3ILX2_EUCGL
MDDDSKFELWCYGVFMIAVLILVVLLSIFSYLICILVGPEYPKMNVAELTVSTASAGVIWNAALLVEQPEDFGDLFFREVECFVYYHWDATQPLALASVEPFVLRSIDKTVIKVKITMERPVEEVLENMNIEQRSVGTVAVGLGLRMQGTYVLGSWWKREYGHIEAYCDNVKVAFANSTGEGRLVTGDTGGSLPSCSYNRVKPEDAAIMFL